MKTKKNILHLTTLFVTLSLLFMVIALPKITAKADSGYTVNEYKGKTYETAEEIKDLEKILRSEGYICVSRWCTDDEEVTDLLAGEDSPFILKQWLDYDHAKIYASELTINSIREGGYDAMDSVLIDSYVEEEEAQHLEGKVDYNYTEKPLSSDLEGTCTLIINSKVNDEILKKYAFTKAIFIFQSYDNDKVFEIDLNAANGFCATTTIARGNYFVKSMTLGEDCTPSYDVEDFSIGEGDSLTLNFDFTSAWVSEGGDETEITTSEEEVSELTPGDVTPEIVKEVAPEKKNWMPLIVTVASFGLLAIAVLVIVLVIKKKTNSGSM